MTTFHGKHLSFPLVLSQNTFVSKVILNSDSLGVFVSEAFYRRIGPGWGETTSGTKSERNLRSLEREISKDKEGRVQSLLQVRSQ